MRFLLGLYFLIQAHVVFSLAYKRQLLFDSKQDIPNIDFAVDCQYISDLQDLNHCPSVPFIKLRGFYKQDKWLGFVSVNPYSQRNPNKDGVSYSFLGDDLSFLEDYYLIHLLMP